MSLEVIGTSNRSNAVHLLAILLTLSNVTAQFRKLSVLSVPPKASNTSPNQGSGMFRARSDNLTERERRGGLEGIKMEVRIRERREVEVGVLSPVTRVGRESSDRWRR